MPGRDGTGPMGFGAKAGRGFRRCRGFGYSAETGFALGLGGRRCFARNAGGLKTSKELLTEEKRLLQIRMDEIEKQIKEM